jgi:hypothetical protein
LWAWRFTRHNKSCDWHIQKIAKQIVNNLLTTPRGSLAALRSTLLLTLWKYYFFHLNAPEIAKAMVPIISKEFIKNIFTPLLLFYFIRCFIIQKYHRAGIKSD